MTIYSNYINKEALLGNKHKNLGTSFKGLCQNNFSDNINDNSYNTTDTVNPANPKYTNAILITEKERLILVQAMRYNDNYIMPYVSDKKIIKSLLNKGFIEKIRINKTDLLLLKQSLFIEIPFNQKQKTKFNNIYKVKKNVELLFNLEGNTAFDEIIEPKKKGVI
jgi:hypothetical protein